MNVRLLVAAAIVAVALYKPAPEPPEPPPTPSPSFRLAGLFVGDTAAEDAAMLAALCDEIADEIEWDGQQSEPLLKTGVAMDTLRTRAREARMKGESVGSRQPKVRDAVARHLMAEVGDSGGLVTPEQRGRWVIAYRDIAEACRDAMGR